MSKPTPIKEEAQAATPSKSKKLLIIGGVLVLMLVAGGAGFYFSKGDTPAEQHPAEVKEEAHVEPKFVGLGDNFTVNLQREEGDQYLQAGITLKILQPELEEKIKAMLPEIRSRLLFLLSSKKPSELQTVEGKKKLVAEIIAEADAVLGLGAAPAHAAAVPAAASAPAAHEGEAASAAAAAVPASAPVQVAAAPKTTGVVDVLFTSFIIQ